MLKDFGRDLKEIRESKNITIAEISAQTRINPKFIMNIESGIFDFQPDTYIRAFLKEYAKCINESEEQILNNYGKAKAGFYARKKSTEDTHTIPVKPVETESRNLQADSNRERKEPEAPKEQTQKLKISNTPLPDKYYDSESKEEYSNKTLTQKILLGLVIVIGIIGIFYLYKTLSSPDKRPDIKPKTFNEISEDYENKIKGKHEDTASLKTNKVENGADSLRLTIRALREVRVKIYVDEKRIVEEVIQPKDSLVVPAKQQYRFSASANSSIELLLNGKLLKKPSYLSSTSIKNLVINKDGIAAQ
ncbi:MAG: helix-turn-helix domain-containing protein [Ignavibacteria bacterium]